MGTLTIHLSKKQSIFHTIVFLLLSVMPLIFYIIISYRSEYFFERKNIAIGLLMFFIAFIFFKALRGEFFFLRLKNPKMTFTDEGILFDEYIQGMVKWEEVAHINFGRRVMMRKPSEKYSSMMIVLKNKATVKFNKFSSTPLDKHFIEIDTAFFKENVNDEIERIIEFISTHCRRYECYKVPHQTKFVFK
ncbi:hypothetical protein [Capnocytophaga sputigena]|jgi:hypothetical protein|uniref:hypothetical protein n=1 Tax=Capnocytophaga sputigena TaxID=1019 RepID=UPI000BB1EF82|nr:hypothetical protein [Capnocytophaga sputigena]ATA70860.1 hypothetical protein CGC57_08075 [Capnocytophaga sputigena]PBN47501.1 hypothetical protein CDC50_02630 [Capnocytophaga sputigena]VEI55041.1 Uncharacterised protein [Capnocytophaga sputigena]